MKFALAALAAFGVSLLAPAPASAAFFGGHAIEAPSLVETVQVCTVRTVRRVRGGRVVVNRVRSCRPSPVVRRTIVTPFFRAPVARGCRTVQTRTRVGNRVVVRSVRRC